MTRVGSGPVRVRVVEFGTGQPDFVAGLVWSGRVVSKLRYADRTGPVQTRPMDKVRTCRD